MVSFMNSVYDLCLILALCAVWRHNSIGVCHFIQWYPIKQCTQIQIYHLQWHEQFYGIPWYLIKTEKFEVAYILAYLGHVFMSRRHHSYIIYNFGLLFGLPRFVIGAIYWRWTFNYITPNNVMTARDTLGNWRLAVHLGIKKHPW